jgi:hypothetical protein
VLGRRRVPGGRRRPLHGDRRAEARSCRERLVEAGGDEVRAQRLELEAERASMGGGLGHQPGAMPKRVGSTPIPGSATRSPMRSTPARAARVSSGRSRR